MSLHSTLEAMDTSSVPLSPPAPMLVNWMFAIVPERRVVFGQHIPVPITRRGRHQQPGHNQVTTRPQAGHSQVM